MFYVVLYFKVESYGESCSNVLIKICKRNGCMVSLFINKLVCFFWKKYSSSGLGYRNFVVVWFIYIFYLYKYGF